MPNGVFAIGNDSMATSRHLPDRAETRQGGHPSIRKPVGFLKVDTLAPASQPQHDDGKPAQVDRALHSVKKLHSHAPSLSIKPSDDP